MQEPSESIIRRIQKLLATGKRGQGNDGTCNEAEAAAAMNLAQALLAKHNLEAAVVEAAFVQGGTTEAAPEKREKTRTNRYAGYKWQRELWAAVCEANFCWHSIAEVFDVKRNTTFMSKRPVPRHVILGRESNVIAVRIMGEYLEDTIERIVVSEGGFKNSERLSRSANSFKAGASDRLVERIREQAEARKAEGGAGTSSGNGKALVLRDVFQAEYQANYDAQYGAGAWARKLLMDAEWAEGQEARNKRAAEVEEKAEREWLEYLANESPVEKKQRERLEEKERIQDEKRSARSHRSWRNEQYREAGKFDQEAYHKGAKAGDNVNLSTQLGEGRKDRSLGGKA